MTGRELIRLIQKHHCAESREMTVEMPNGDFHEVVGARYTDDGKTYAITFGNIVRAMTAEVGK